MAEKKEEPKESTKVKVVIQFCGGWGYAAKFRAAKDILDKKFPDCIDIISNKDPQSTGNFEITVDGTLVHSKKTKGHGFFHTNAEQQEIVFKAIQDAIDKKWQRNKDRKFDFSRRMHLNLRSKI